MVMEVVHEDMGEGNMQCTNHPNKNSIPGGICAVCLQEKLGKLVSSSYPAAIFPSSSSSPSPSFRSTFNGSSTTTSAASAGGGGGSGSSTLQLSHLASSSQNGGNDCSHHARKSRLPFVLTSKKKKKKGSEGNSSDSTSMVFKRSKSIATPKRGIHNFLDENYGEDYSPNRRRFWSFLYLSKQSNSRKSGKQLKDLNFTSSVNNNGGGNGIRSREKQREESIVVVDENGSPSFDRKVSRSRSVGCGSRSFSGDFFERISTGFGDCTLRRVESQREGKPKIQSLHKNGGGENNGQDCIKQRVKCGGIFSGFMTTSSSSSSSSYLIEDSNLNGKSSSMSESHSSMGNLSHGRSRSWGWAFASPMRAFGKNSAVKRENKNATPNLAAVPSLLAVSG